MPNYVYVNIGRTEEIDALLLNERGEVDFNILIPMPPHQPDPEKEGYFNAKDGINVANVNSGLNWYDWSIKNWGTKWNACDSYVDECYISFSTAWSLPEPVIRKLMALTSVYGDFEEEANFFKGEFTGDDIVYFE